MVRSTIVAFSAARSATDLQRSVEQYLREERIAAGEWKPGSIELQIGGDEGRAHALVGHDPASTRRFVSRLAHALGSPGVAVVLDGTADAPGKRLTMSGRATLFDVDAEGAWTERPTSVDAIEHEDEEPSLHPPAAEDLLIALAKWLSDCAWEVLGDAGEPPPGPHRARYAWQPPRRTDLPARLAALADQIEAARSWEVAPQPDGRAMVVIERAAGGVQRSFISETELSALRASVSRPERQADGDRR